MCGIVGYIGKSQAFPILLEGLKKLEYRGYDSFGFCVLDKDKEYYRRQVGKISEFNEKSIPEGLIGLGHSRWATTGAVTESNAHPHEYKGVYVVHNGIVENYKELKEELVEKGHKFSSETDTEVIAHLIYENLKGNLEEAVRKALKRIRGTYGIAVISKDDPEKVVVARLSSPIILGIGDGEYLVASDASAIVNHTQKVINLEDNEIAVLTKDNYFILKEKPLETIEWDSEEAQKHDYPHFMIKEIMEESYVIENATKGRLILGEGKVKLGGLDGVAKKFKKAKKILLVGCGTGYYAAKTGEYLIEEIAKIPTEAHIASELRYRENVVEKDTVAIFVSQSGETADNLAALRKLKEQGVLCLGVTNVVGSTQTRETEAGVYTRSGPEIAVASTKALLGQITTLVMIGVYLANQRDVNVSPKIVQELSIIPEKAKQVLNNEDKIKELAEKYKDFKDFWFIGRKFNYPIALEGALKLKEISYIHAEGTPGGELKHGPLALIEESVPTVAICPKDSVYDKMMSNIEEIRAREGSVIVVATEGDNKIKEMGDDVIYIPETMEILYPLLTVIPLHLFSYYVAVALGRDVDKPRNLAKSVTVE